MSESCGLRSRVRVFGLVSSVASVLAIAVTLIAGNHSAGFGWSVTYDEQLFLLLAAAVLCAAQIAGYLMRRHRGDRPQPGAVDKKAGEVP